MVGTDGRLARGEASRGAMLAAAILIVATEGIQALTHRAVAARIGVSHARVVYHFASVADLRHATLLQAGTAMIDQLAQLMNRRYDPALVPGIAADLAVAMVTKLRNETVTLYTLMTQATRDEHLRPAVSEVNKRIADLIEPLSGNRELASAAASALLGLILEVMAEGRDVEPATVRAQVVGLIEYFDPRRSAAEGRP